MRLGWFFALCCGFVLSGCATAPDRIDPASAAKLRRAGVVSLVATDFHRGYTGATVFGNEHEKKDIAAWAVDAEYEAQARRALAALGTVEPVVLAFDRASLAQLAATRWTPGDLKGQGWEPAREKFKALCAAHPVDALVVAVTRWSPDFLAQTNQSFRGAGFYARGMGDSTMVAVMHLVADAIVVDCPSGEAVASRMLSKVQSGHHGQVRSGVPLAMAPPALARSKIADWSEATAARVRSELIALPSDAWQPTLRALLKGE